MRVTNIMTAEPVTVSSKDQLRKVKQIYDTKNFHHLMVVEKEKLVGIITDGDLYKAMSSHLSSHSGERIGAVTLDARVEKMMKTDVVCLKDNENVMRAIHLFNEHHISCLPVVNVKQEPIGIVSWRDVMKYLESRVMDKVNK